MTTATRAPRVETTAPKGREARAAMILAVYLGLGPNRRLERASEIASAAGLRVNRSTLMAYSRDYHFVERASEFDAERMQAVQKVALREAIATDVEQMNLARLLSSYGEHVIKSHLYDAEGKVKVDLSPESVSDGIRAAAEGFKMMRLISGQATAIDTSVTAFYWFIIKSIGGIWEEAIAAADKVLEDADVPEDVRERARLAAQAHYGDNADRALHEHYRALGMDTALLDADPGPAGTIYVEERDA